MELLNTKNNKPGSQVKNMKIPFFVQEFTDEMEAAAVATLRNESFVGGESVSKISTT